MTTYAVGDIQGCLEPLKQLLESVHFDPQYDQLLCVGDLVNRGPHSLETLRFVKSLGKSAVAVLGNHDLHLLAVYHQTRKAAKKDTFEEIFAADDCDELMKWLQCLPILHHDPQHRFTLVHAGVAPQWDMQQAQSLAREVEEVLRGDAYLEFFRNMYGDEPSIWDNSLSGSQRLRVITNYFTRMRFVTPEGGLDLRTKCPPGEQSPELVPWFEHPQRKTKNDLILFGHWAALDGKSTSPYAIALDTGCVWGGQLSLYCLETNHWYRCGCKT